MPTDVSIIIPTYNRQRFLIEVLPSYLAQQNVGEVIVVDDGSTPPVREALPAELLELPQLHVVRHRRSLGLCMARNRGIDEAEGSLVFFGEDDLLLPADHIERLLEQKKQLNADLICGSLLQQVGSESLEEALARVADKPGPVFDRRHISVLTENLREPRRLPFAHAIFMAPRKLLADYRFSGHLGGPSFLREDGELQLRLHRDGYRLFGTPETASLHLARNKTADSGTRSADSVWAQIASSALNSWQVIDEYYPEISPFFSELSKKEMSRRAVSSALLVGLKRHARANNAAFNLAVTYFRKML